MTTSTDEIANNLLTWICKSTPDTEFPTADAAKAFQWSLPTARKYLTFLADSGYLTSREEGKRGRRSPGRKILWKLAKLNVPMSFLVAATPIKFELEVPEPLPPMEMTTATLARLVTRWGDERWEPAVIRRLHHLPLSLALLLENIDHMLNGDVQKINLQEVKQPVDRLLEDINNLQRVVQAIVSFSALWKDPIILTDHIDPDKLGELVKKFRILYPESGYLGK